MFKSILLKLLIIVLFIPESSLFADSSNIKNMNNGTITNFSHIKSNYEYLSSNKIVNRREYETLESYDNRLREANKAFDNFIRNSYYILDYSFTSTSLDWGSGLVHITYNPPLKVIRKRQIEEYSNGFTITVQLAPNKAREIHQSNRNIHTELWFHIDYRGYMIIDKLKISYYEALIYEE